MRELVIKTIIGELSKQTDLNFGFGLADFNDELKKQENDLKSTCSLMMTFLFYLI
jgi:hypothetical protein